MFRAYVLNDVAYAAKAGGGTISGKNEVKLLAPGAIAIFSDLGVLIPIAALSTTLLDVKAVYFAFGKKNGGAQTSQLIPRDPMVEYSAKSYAAGAAEVQFLGQDSGGAGALNLPTLTAGLEWTVSIADESRATMDPTQRRKYRASGIVVTGDTAATILAAAAAALNAQSDNPVTVAVVAGNVGLSFTADTVGTTFTVEHGGIFIDSTTEVGGAGASVKFNLGTGTYAQVLEMLKLSANEFGKDDGGYLTDKFWSFESNAVSTGTYDVYLFKWKIAPAGAIGPRRATTNEMAIILPAGPATFSQANFQAAMGAIFGTDTTSAVETGDDTA